MIRKFAALVIATFLSFSPSALQAEEVWKFAQAPWTGYINDKGEGPLINYLRDLEKTAGVKIEIKVLPPKRALQAIATGEADAYFGMMVPENKIMRKFIPGRWSDFTLNVVDFMIYSKDKLDVKDLKGKKIATGQSLDKLFNIKLTAERCGECMLKKVAAGRLDGVLSVAGAAEPAIQHLNLNLQKQLYAKIPVKVLFRKNAPKEMEAKMAKAVDTLIRSGATAKHLPLDASTEFMKNYVKK